MTSQQIEEYQYASKYLEYLKGKKTELDKVIGHQHFGASSQSPFIEHTLEKIHRDMYEKIRTVIIQAEMEVNDIIDKI